MDVLRKYFCFVAISLSPIFLSKLVRSEPNADYVTAVSRYGNGTISAPIRSDARGSEVELPGGRWVFCRRSCSETLRVETIDFFEANTAGNGQLTNECGIFGCLDLKYHR
jgi:hypothetical protein